VKWPPKLPKIVSLWNNELCSYSLEPCIWRHC